MKNFINYQNKMNNQNNYGNFIENYNAIDNMNNPSGYNNMNVGAQQNLYEPYQGFIRGNMFPNLYDEYKITRPFEVEPMNEQAELLTYIDSLCFAAHDLNLYLDNFPNDQQMIQKFNEYRMESNRAIEQYENQYGPLFVNSNANAATPWAWDNRPWPWEN